MKQFSVLLFLIISFTAASAQNTDCKVLSDSLKGTYAGGCKDGKASGDGKATGIATYEGEFKNGYPDGKGKYTWANGDFYYGGWKKGLKDGKGEVHYIGNEKLIKGFWKKDKYKGEYEEPYQLHEIGTAISYKSVQHLGTQKMSVYISMKTGVMGIANVDNYTVINGLYQRTTNTEMSQTKTIEFQDVQFPFRVRFNGIDKGMIDIEFYEAGEWRVDISL
jgi:hypothetical protein